MVFQTHPLPGSEHGVHPPKNYSFSFEDEDQTWDFYVFSQAFPKLFFPYFFNTAPMAHHPSSGPRHRWHLNLQHRIALREAVAIRQRQVAQPDDAHGDQTWLPRRLPLQNNRDPKTEDISENTDIFVRNRCFMMFTFHWDRSGLEFPVERRANELYDAIWCYMMLYDAIWVSAKRNFCSNHLISLISLEEYLKQRKQSQDSSSWTGNPWRISLVHHELVRKRPSGASDWSGYFESPRFRLHMVNSCEFLGIFIPSRPQTIQIC